MIRHLWLAIATVFFVACDNSGATTCTVSRVVDGDSFECSSGTRVRMIGIDAPELSQRPHGNRARSALLSIMPIGRTVRLESDREPYDRHGRALAYVWVGDTLVNIEIVAQGFAMAGRFPPNTSRQEGINKAMDDAKQNRLGLWSSGGFECRPSARRRNDC